MQRQQAERRTRGSAVGGPYGAPLDDGAHRKRLEHDVGCRDVGVGVEPVGRHPPRHPRQHGRQVGIVGTRDHAAVKRHLVGEIDERLLQVVESAVVFQMFVVDVRHHRYRRKQFQKRSVTLVCFRHHQLAASEPRVAAECPQPAADDGRRIQPRSLEHQRNHRRRRCLAVRAGDGDAEPEPHELREHFRPRDHRNLPPYGFPNLRVGGPHRSGDHDDVRVADVRGLVRVRDADAYRLEPIGDRRPLFVGSADRVAEIGEQLGDAAHPDAANPDEMHAPRLA